MVKYSNETLQDGVSISEVYHQDILNDADKFEQIFGLQKEFDSAEKKYYKDLLLGWVDCTKTELRDNLINKVSRIFVASYMGKFIGFLTLYPSKMGKDSYVIAELVVSKSMRGKRIGRRLLEYTFENTKGYNLFLTVTATNEAGRHLYESVGFKPVSTFMVRNKNNKR